MRTLLLFLLLAGTAHAGTFTTPDLRPYNRALDTSLEPVPARIELTVQNCPGAPADTSCTLGSRIWLSGRHAARSDILMHEVGHVQDRQRMNDRERAAFARLDGRSFDGERFASAYSLCALYGVPPFSWPVLTAWQPSAALHRRVCRRLRGWLSPSVA